MSKKILFFLLIPFLGFSQIQIGQDIDGEAAGDVSGSSISLSSDGKILAVGASFNDGNGNDSGHVRVYENISGTWTQIGQDIDGEATGDHSGCSVSLSSNGEILAVGAQSNDGNGSESGHARIYEYISGVWTQIGQDINGEFANDGSGVSVCLSSDGKIIAIGAYNNDANGTDSGHVRIYKYTLGTWAQIGQDIDGKAAGDKSGYMISLSSDGTIIAIGSHLNDDAGFNAGQVRIYENISGNWTQIGQDINGVAQWEQTGISISLSAEGNIVAVGSFYGSYTNKNNIIINSGLVRIYENISGVWTQIGQDIGGEANFDTHGVSVSLSLSGSIVAVGAPFNDGNGIDSGHVRIYENISGVWTQIFQDIDGEAPGDSSGRVVLSSDGTIVAIGAMQNDGNGNDSGHVRVFELKKAVSVNDFVSQNFEIFPNPTSDILNISLESNLVLEQVIIYNNLGQIVKTATENVIDVSHLAKGLYFVEVTTKQGKATKKLIIN